MLNTDTLSAAREDFRRARQQAALQELMARVTGQSIDLLAFEEVRRKLRATAMSERGLQDIPVSAIVGSAGRYTDFTRDFLPRAAVDEVRWARVKQAAADAGGLPPIEVYQVGDAYFVRDGHHRVSVARAMGVETIAAYVTEVRAKVPLSPEHQPDDLIRMAEYAEFLEATRLDELRPGADLSVSALGQYQRLLDHIEVHRYVVETESGRSLSDDEAVVSWYDQAYLPIVQVIRERGLLRDFPGRTETDLYLWLVEHAAELREELGWPVKPQAVAEELAAQFSPRRRRWGQRVLNLVTAKALVDGPAPGAWRKDRLEARYLERLFPDVLVPVSGEPEGWRALDQALVFARREGARLLGLHVVGEEAARTGPAAQAVRAEFGRRCAEAGAEGTLVVVDPSSGAELVGPEAVLKVIEDKRLTAVFQRAGRRSREFRVAQIKAALSEYWPANDSVTVVVNGRTLVGRVSDIVRSEAGMATLFDRKVNTGKIAPFVEEVTKLMAERGLTSLDDVRKHERELIQKLKYRHDFLADSTLSQPK